MTWQLTPYAKTREPLNRVPWRDLSDEEFAAADALYEGLLQERGYFVPVPVASTPAPEPEVEPEREPTRHRGRRHVNDFAAAPAVED